MKSSAIVKIVLLGVIAIILLLIMIGVLFNDNVFFNFWKYDKVELYNETFSLEDIEKLDLNMISYDVTVRNSDDNMIHVIVNGKEDRKDKIELSSDSKVLKVTELPLKSICFGLCFWDDEVIVYLPKEFNKEMKINNTSGDITFLDSYMSDVNVQSVSGDVKLLEVSDLYVKTVSGDISIIKGDKVEASTTSGDISLDKATESYASAVSGDINIGSTGNVELNTVSGDINVSDLVVNGTSNIETKSGDVKIHKINETYVETKTTSGDVSISNNNRKSENTLNVNTISGDIVVR